MDKQIKVESLWKAIDDILDVDVNNFSEDVKKKYFALKSLLIKESEYLRVLNNMPDYTTNMLTENVDFNIKFLKEDTEDRLRKLANKNETLSEVVSEALVDDVTYKKVLLETLMAGDYIEQLLSKNKQSENLGAVISGKLVESFCETLVDFTNAIKAQNIA